jgi:hypothetical protein
MAVKLIKNETAVQVPILELAQQRWFNSQLTN